MPAVEYELKPAFIDVEFEQWRPGDEGGGYIEDPAEESTYGIAFPDELLIPRSEWRDRIEERKQLQISNQSFHPYVYNQSPESSCVYNAACGCHTICYNQMVGIENQIVLSPMSGYSQVAGHRHSGSTMWGALERFRKFGVLPSSGHGQKQKFKHTFHENTPFSRRLPEGWQETAVHFQVTEWLRIDSREQFASALLQGRPICYGRKGHSICAEDLIWDGRFYVSYCDSYSTSRGRNGRLLDSEANWATGGAWAPLSVKVSHDASLAIAI